jgi:hypothetical protein
MTLLHSNLSYSILKKSAIKQRITENSRHLLAGRQERARINNAFAYCERASPQTNSNVSRQTNTTNLLWRFLAATDNRSQFDLNRIDHTVGENFQTFDKWNGLLALFLPMLPWANDDDDVAIGVSLRRRTHDKIALMRELSSRCAAVVDGADLRFWVLLSVAVVENCCDRSCCCCCCGCCCCDDVGAAADDGE